MSRRPSDKHSSRSMAGQPRRPPGRNREERARLCSAPKTRQLRLLCLSTCLICCHHRKPARFPLFLRPPVRTVARSQRPQRLCADLNSPRRYWLRLSLCPRPSRFRRQNLRRPQGLRRVWRRSNTQNRHAKRLRLLRQLHQPHRLRLPPFPSHPARRRFRCSMCRCAWWEWWEDFMWYWSRIAGWCCWTSTPPMSACCSSRC